MKEPVASDACLSAAPATAAAAPAPEATPVPSPTAGEPLDGRQFHNVIDEQRYAEQPPTHEEQTPWRIHHRPGAALGTDGVAGTAGDQSSAASHEGTRLSVGDAG